jgi:hypothetical protein
MDQEWDQCSRNAYNAVIPRFTWKQIDSDLLQHMKGRGDAPLKRD